MSDFALRDLTVRRRVHVGMAVAASIVVGVAYSILLPLFIAPDEPAHLDGVRHLVVDGGYLTGGTAVMSKETIIAERMLGTLSPARRYVSGDATSRHDRPSFADLREMELGRPPDVNYIANHPPTYYIGTGLLSRTVMSFFPTGMWSYDREILLMRWISVLLLAGTTALTYPLARVVGLGHRGGLVAMVLPLTIPQYVHIGSSINNDNLYVLAGTAFALSMLLLVRPDPDGRLDPRVALATGLTGALVALSKIQGLVALFMLGGLAIWMWRTSRKGRRRSLIGLVVPPLLTAGVYYAVAYVRTGSFIPRETTPPTPVRSDPDVVAWAKEYLRLGSRTFWGAFGWLDAAIPPGLPWVLTAIAVVVLVGSLVYAWVTRRRWLLVPWLFGAMAVGLPVYASLMVNLRGGGMRAMQGRYAYPLVPLAACTMLLALRPLMKRVRPVPVVAAVLVGLVAIRLQQLSLQVILARHWGPSGGSVRESLGALAAWAPTPLQLSMVIGVLGVLGMGFAVVTPVVATVSAVGSGRSESDPDEDLGETSAVDADVVEGGPHRAT